MTNHLSKFICNDDGRNDEEYLLISQGRLDGAPRDAWEASAAWLDAADFERFRRGLYPRLLNTSSPAGPVVARRAS
ncbi:hypothetical protein RYA05_28300 [Pseudomonas syringae pv. actinidiae]|uniref:Uncharacterized protein n=2 Tax=Pseudomonas syringae TaxID=317 RepID=A0AAN4TPX8_PSESF|nr:hypothetical protein [Pseudomonas syringae]EPN65097.1 hypothetical protein A234_34626 [Pseudomonas syringae pv. actinidiae ICMP 19101]EPN74066.1 hypothetical protein A235_00105 [Pseudomonas syringae pv. actinidiae ICMP 19079]PPS27302.1 hypothetical protein BVY12_26610 [Pseudomonas amygdali pv. morsprunorum]AKT33637.1 hypothetical protein IYO_029730 [Pseudomonas syringae pv. actinidiae ICMP 18884]AOE60196.1 hypothetical protein NZ708_29605 [Pseudomonas syringae pv. actinidiae ICMP 18708]